MDIHPRQLTDQVHDIIKTLLWFVRSTGYHVIVIGGVGSRVKLAEAQLDCHGCTYLMSPSCIIRASASETHFSPHSSGAEFKRLSGSHTIGGPLKPPRSLSVQVCEVSTEEQVEREAPPRHSARGRCVNGL